MLLFSTLVEAPPSGSTERSFREDGKQKIGLVKKKAKKEMVAGKCACVLERSVIKLVSPFHISPYIGICLLHRVH